MDVSPAQSDLLQVANVVYTFPYVCGRNFMIIISWVFISLWIFFYVYCSFFPFHYNFKTLVLSLCYIFEHNITECLRD